jgi:hypothetical protein
VNVAAEPEPAVESAAGEDFFSVTHPAMADAAKRRAIRRVSSTGTLQWTLTGDMPGYAKSPDGRAERQVAGLAIFPSTANYTKRQGDDERFPFRNRIRVCRNR